MTETEAIQAVSDQYRRDGYTVAVQPHTELAPFSEIPEVDLIATKADEIIAIVMQRQVGQEAEPVIVASGTRGDDDSLTLLAEAKKLFMPETRRAALLMAAMAFEAAAREVLQSDHRAERRTSAVLIQELAARGLIDPIEGAKIRQAMHVRNLITHGVQPTEILPDFITCLLDAVRKIKFSRSTGSGQIRAGASATIIRHAVNRNLEVRRRVEMAEMLLDEVLGPARAEVSVDWNLGEDGQGQPVILLKLSDFTGTVSGSFALNEFDQPTRLKTRLYKIWGDLLGLRIAEQLKNLTGTKGIT